MFSKRSVFNCFVILALLAGLGACQPPLETATAPPPDTPKPEEPTSTSAPAPPESVEWVFPENWWLETQVWAEPPDLYFTTDTDGNQTIWKDFYDDYAPTGFTVITWFIGPPNIVDEFHDRGLMVVASDTMIPVYGPLYDSWFGGEDPPKELEPAAIRDPYSNILVDDFDLADLFDLPYLFTIHSMIHPLWQERMIEEMKAYIDAGVDGYMIDELAFGSTFFPDFNPNTLEKFSAYLQDTYNDEELQNLGAPWGIGEFTNFDYAALVRDHLPAEKTELTKGDWDDWDLRTSLPLMQQFDRFLAIENQKAALRILDEGRTYALENYGKEIPFSANLGALVAPQTIFYIDKLDYSINEFPYDMYGYFPAARTTGTQKLYQHFNRPATYMTQLTTKPDIIAWGVSNTVNLYRTIIADAIANGGAADIEQGEHAYDQDMNLLGPYYRFPLDYPFLFDELEPITNQIGVLRLWEADIYAPWDQWAYVGLCDLLADSGYQFGALFGAEEFLIEGELPNYPAPNHPLRAEDLARHEVIMIPELYTLTDNHAEILLDYVDAGGTLIIFSLPYTTYDMDGTNPLHDQLLTTRGEGTILIGQGKLIHVEGIWGKDFLENPNLDAKNQLRGLLESEGIQPLVMMNDTRYLGATAYKGADQMVVHFVNYDHEEGIDITTPTGPVDVAITLPNGLQLYNPALYLFTPGEMPQSIDGVLDDNLLRLTLPNVDIWSVLLIGEEDSLNEQVAALPTFTPTPLPPTPTQTPEPLPTLSSESFDAGYVVYDDALSIGWSLDPWGGTADLSSPESVYQGSNALEVTLDPSGGITFDVSNFDATAYDFMIFYFNGAESTDQQLYVEMKSGDNVPLGEKAYLTDSYFLDDYPLQPGQWYMVMIPLSHLNPEGKPIAWFDIGDASGDGAATFYLDEIRFVATGP